MFGEEIVKSVIDVASKFIPDPAERDKFALEMATLQVQTEQTEIQADAQVAVAQNKVNEVQAGSSDKYTSRMRPTAGYACMATIVYAGIIQPAIIMIADLLGHKMVVPSVETGAAITILMTLCGARSWEKIKGVTTSWVNPG